MKMRIATFVAVLMAVSTVFAAKDSPTKTSNAYNKASWVLNLGLAKPTGDHETLGFDNMFMLGVDYMMGTMGDQMGASGYLGALYMAGNGAAGLDSRTVGVH